MQVGASIETSIFRKLTSMPKSDHSSDHDAVLASFAAYVNAIKSKDAVAAIHCFDGEAVTFDFAPPLENRFDALKDPKGLEEWFETWTGPIQTDVGDTTVTVSGDLAVLHGLQRLHGSKKDGDVDMWYRATVVMARKNTGWRITHIHNSVPMAMDGSGQALTDLKPE